MNKQFGEYLVVEESENFFGIYNCTFYPKVLITHKENWRQATKLAKMLNEAFQLGWNEAKDTYL